MSIVKAQPHDRRAYESAKRSEAEDRLYRRPAPARASGDAPPCEPERAQDGANVRRARQRIEAIYTQYAPDKLVKLDHLLRKYQGKEEKLADAIEKKYVTKNRAKGAESEGGGSIVGSDGGAAAATAGVVEDTPEVKTPEPPADDSSRGGDHAAARRAGGGAHVEPRRALSAGDENAEPMGLAQAGNQEVDRAGPSDAEYEDATDDEVEARARRGAPGVCGPRSRACARARSRSFQEEARRLTDFERIYPPPASARDHHCPNYAALKRFAFDQASARATHGCSWGRIDARRGRARACRRTNA